jgi:hypothetical protein
MEHHKKMQKKATAQVSLEREHYTVAAFLLWEEVLYA